MKSHFAFRRDGRRNQELADRGKWLSNGTVVSRELALELGDLGRQSAIARDHLTHANERRTMATLTATARSLRNTLTIR